MSLTFSKEFLSSPEIVRLIEMLRIKELLSKSQINTDEAIKLDDELKENWWKQIKTVSWIKFKVQINFENLSGL